MAPLNVKLFAPDFNGVETQFHINPLISGALLVDQPIDPPPSDNKVQVRDES